MTSKLRIEWPEAMCHVMDLGDQNEHPRRRSEALEVFPECQ
jgi:hypothetical protein